MNSKLLTVGIRNTKGERLETETLATLESGCWRWKHTFRIPAAGGTYDKVGVRASNGNWVWFGMTAQTFPAQPVRQRLWNLRRTRPSGWDDKIADTFTVTATIPTGLYDVLDGFDMDKA